MDDLYSMTVAQLKERLKEKGLPVSGKKAELIARLREGEEESFVPDEKYNVDCAKCGTTLRVPTDYSGGITCPNCMTKTQVTSPLSTDDVPNLTGVVSDLQGVGEPQHVVTSGYDFVTGPDGQTYDVCCFLIILSEVGAGVGAGFAAGKPGIGIGVITAVVALPLIFFAGCFFLLASYGY